MSKHVKKKKLNMKKVGVVALIVIIVLCAIVVFKPKKIKTPSGIEVVNTGTKKDKEITEENAKKAAVKQFKKIGEEGIKQEEVKALKIKRDDEYYYYYMTSKQNTMEIKIVGGKITRINSTPVEE